VLKRMIFLFLVLLAVQIANAGKLQNFKAKNIKNKNVYYEDIKGEKLTIIDFWATWCKPCVRSIPKLVEVYNKYKDQGVQFIGINVDGNRNLPKVKPMVRSLKITYPVLLDLNNQIMNDLNITSIPYLLIVDSENNIVATHIGYRPGDEKILEEEIANFLNKSGEKGNEN